MQGKQDAVAFLRQVIIDDDWYGESKDALESVLSELEQLRTQNGKMQFTLESISGCYEVDYAIRRANKVLAEIGVPGYEAEAAIRE